VWRRRIDFSVDIPYERGELALKIVPQLQEIVPHASGAAVLDVQLQYW
jgi:hypothetical protein